MQEKEGAALFEPCPFTQKIPRPNGLGIMVEHSPQHSNPNRLFQILRKIPRTTENTVNLHGSDIVVDLIKYKILVNDHFAIYRVKRIDFTHI